jgi:8-oxo-dGTP pyrophosphatase MutT (NUDIX family)
VLIPVGDGLLTVRRGIEPQKGHLALPGGFIDYGETWEEAAKREAQEETGLILPSVSFLTIETASNANILIFCQAAPTSIDLQSFQPNREVSELVVIARPVDLAFSTHTKMARKFFDSSATKD